MGYRALFIVLGALSAAFGLEGFLLPSGFIDGGITGLSMILARVSGIPLPALVLCVNIPFLLLASRQFGKNFALRGACAVGLLALLIGFVEIEPITHDKLLAAVFGGAFLGGGIGLAIRGGSVLDGTEVLALVVSKGGATTVGDVILALNLVIFTLAGIVLGVEPALYSVLTYASASKAVDFLIHGVEEYYAIMIVSSRADQLRRALVDDMKRSVTRFRGGGGLSESDQDILFCVVTRLEVAKIKSSIHQLDHEAFVVVHHVSDIVGGVRRKRVIERIASEAKSPA